jgi:diaminopimelate decarboxylase
MKKENLKQIFSEVMSHENAAFVIDQSKFEHNLISLRSAFLNYYPEVFIGYSYKTNYVPTICRAAHKLGCWAEVVSSMEVDMALIHLEEKSNIIYNGPVKSFDSIQKVIEVGGIINIDDLHDIEKIEQILKKVNPLDNIVKVALRLNFEYDGQPSRFGIEINRIEDFIQRIDKNPRLKLSGYHIHLPFRSVDSFKFRIGCVLEVLNIHGARPLDYINVGGGFFGEITPELAKNMNIQNLPTYIDYGKIVGRTLSDYFIKSETKIWPKLFIEPGSSVVADALWFLSRVHTLKKIGKKNILISYSGRHLLTPTNKSLLFPIELYITEDSNLNIIDDDLYVVGYTCIESDILGKVEVRFKSNSSDFIAISNVGSYSIVMGSDFILPQPAIYNFSNIGLSIVRHRKTIETIMSEFIY